MSAPTPRPRLLSGGAKALFWVGVVLTGIALAILALALVTTVRSVPRDIVTLSGEPGSKVVAVIPTGATGTASLAADVEYSFFLVHREGTPEPQLDGDILVTAPDGTDVEVTSGAASGFSVTAGKTTGRVIAAMQSPQVGTHEITVPTTVPTTVPAHAEIYVAEVAPVAQFALGIIGGVFGIIVGAFLAVCGVLMAGGGIVWGTIRRQRLPRSG